MAYTTRDAVEIAAGGAARLLQLADFSGEGEEDEGLVEDAIAEADALINSYVRRAGREVPLPEPVPPVVARLSASLAVHILKARRDTLTETDLVQHEQRLAWLAGLVKGEVDLGVSSPPPASPYNRPRASERASSKAVSRANLKGYA